MRNLFKLVFFAVLFLLGCSKDKDVVSSVTEDNELGISASFQDLVITRSLKSEFISGDVVGIFATGTGYSHKVAHYTYDQKSAVWNHPSDFNERIYLSGETATLYGFYPGSLTLRSDGTNKVDINTSSTENSFDGSGQTDYMYASAGYDDKTKTYPLPTAFYVEGAPSPKVNLFFHHALSKLVLILNKDENYSAVGTLSKLSLKRGAEKYFKTGTGTMDVANGEISIKDQTSELKFSGSVNLNNYNVTPSSVATVKVLVLPMDLASDIYFELTIDGTVMKASLPVTTISKWEAGKQYTYKLQLSGKEMKVSSVSILDWSEESGGNASAN
jgi:hypothetical protein